MQLERAFSLLAVATLVGCSGVVLTQREEGLAPAGMVRVGSFGNEQLLSPVSICCDLQGCIYVGDEARVGVHKFKPDFSYEMEFGQFGKELGQILSPVSLSCDGFYIYVVDGRNERVVRYDRYGGFSRLIVPVGTDTVGSGLPVALAVSPTGEMYLAETRPGQVLALDEYGRLKSMFGRFGGNSGLSVPTSVAVGPFSNVYVCDRGAGRVAVYDRFGGYIREIGGLGEPKGLAIDGSGNAFVSDLASGTVTCYDPAGNAVASVGGFRSPSALAIAGDTTLLVVDTENGSVAVCRIQYR
jgi:hypothetical protein